MTTIQSRRATVGACENYRWRVEDETGQVHFLTGYQFDQGAPREEGSRVWIGYRVLSRSGLWHVCAALAEQ